MKTSLAIFSIAIACLTARAANPDFGAFNANQFSTAGNKIAIKDGALLTNIANPNLSNYVNAQIAIVQGFLNDGSNSMNVISNGLIALSNSIVIVNTNYFLLRTNGSGSNLTVSGGLVVNGTNSFANSTNTGGGTAVLTNFGPASFTSQTNTGAIGSGGVIRANGGFVSQGDAVSMSGNQIIIWNGGTVGFVSGSAPGAGICDTKFTRNAAGNFRFATNIQLEGTITATNGFATPLQGLTSTSTNFVTAGMTNLVAGVRTIFTQAATNNMVPIATYKAPTGTITGALECGNVTNGVSFDVTSVSSLAGINVTDTNQFYWFIIRTP